MSEENKPEEPKNNQTRQKKEQDIARSEQGQIPREQDIEKTLFVVKAKKFQEQEVKKRDGLLKEQGQIPKQRDIYKNLIVETAKPDGE